MRTIKSLLAAVLMVVMIACMSVSAFAAYEEVVYDDVNDMYGVVMKESQILPIRFVDKLGIIPASHNGSFSGSDNVSRGEAVRIAYRMLHYDYDEVALYAENIETGFDQMNDGDLGDVFPLRPYIAWAEDYQLVNSEDVPDKKFEPAKPISGEEFITLITKVVGISTGEDNADEYTAFQEIILDGTDIDADSTAVSREQAAVIVARAMLYDPNFGEVNDDLFTTFADYDGNRITCLATEIYGCRKTTLYIRATENRPLNYENITKDVLFSNGVQVDLGADLSSFIGFQTDVIYLDKDESCTYTEDEDLLTYQLASPFVNNVPISDLKVIDFTKIGDESSFGIFSNAQLYLNDDVWPMEELYKITETISYVDFKEAKEIPTRPNLEVYFVQHSADENVDLVLATEWIPGKLMTVTDNHVAVYSYYDNKVQIFDDNDVVMTNLANPKSGDYVNFYVSNGKLHLTEGTTVILDEFSIDGSTMLCKEKGAEKSGSYNAHSFVNALRMPANKMKGPFVAVLDNTKSSYIAVEEMAATEEIAVEILDVMANDDGVHADLWVREVKSGEEYDLSVEIARISSTTGRIDYGSLFTYYITEGGDIYMDGIDPITTTVIETEDYFILDSDTKYLKAEGYVSDTDTLKVGEATIYVDRYEGVWASVK